MKPLILIDGSSYLYRAFHAMPSLTNSKGFPTGAIYGVINMLQKLLTEYDPTHIAVIFDAKGKTFRDALFAQYKAHRPPMPPELAQQIAPLHEVIQALGIPLIVEEGVEADDVIGTLAKQAEKQGKITLISTGDKDMAQLVNAHTTLINTMTNTIYDIEGVKNKFGIGPEQIIDYLSLVGDTADNIPGVPQVGPKTAVKWLNEFGSLDQIIARADQIKGKVGENLRASLHKIPLSKQLTTIKCDVALQHTWDDLKRSTPVKDALITLYSEFEFKTWLSQLLEEKKPTLEDKYSQYETILSVDALNTWLLKLSQSQCIAFDTETTSINYIDARIVGLSFAIHPSKAIYIPLTHDSEEAPKQLDRDEVLKKLKPIFENDNILKIAHNIKYDQEVLANHGIKLQGIGFDTMLESYILDSASNAHGLDALALKYLAWRTIHYEDLTGKGAKQIPFSKVPIAKAATYASEDADVTLQLHQKLWPQLEKEPGLAHIFKEIEMPLIPVLAAMERTGVLIDPNMLDKQTHELDKRLQLLEQKAFEYVGNPFNLNSPKQLQEVLYSKLNLPVLQKTPTGQPSTAESVLQELALEFELPKYIIEYRAISKLISTYTRRLPEQINPDTGRVHTSYNQTVTATGRLSSSDPNLQNIPIRTEEGRRIRQAFIAAPGSKLISADYSQIELRLMAHISGDPTLRNAFEKNLDVHTATAAEVFEIPLEKVGHEERRRAKAINFGLIYGMSAFGLAKQLGIERQAAQAYIARYFARYPLVKEYMESTVQKARALGYVETLWGRRLYLPELRSSQIMRQKAAERAAINAPLQGSAADIIKRAMITLHRWLEQKSSAKMIMQVHDELVIEAPAAEIDHLIVVIREHMMNAADLSVPLTISIGSGDNWDAASAH